MNNEPSLLEYLKSLLDPRRELIRLSETELFDQQAGTPADYQEGVEAQVPLKEDAERGRAAESGLQHPDSDIIEQTDADVRPFPTRTAFMIAFALFAQASLEPPDRLMMMGVVFYGLALIIGIWAFYSGELIFAVPSQKKYFRDNFLVRRTAILISLPMIMFAFILLGGNKFTGINVLFWMLGLLFLILGLSQRPLNNAEKWWRPLNNIQFPVTIKISQWALVVLLAFGIAMFFRFYQLEQVPSQMFSDHAEKLQDVQDVLNGETRIFFPRNTGREFFQMYLTAFAAKYLGQNLTFMALKLGTALAGILTLPFIYLLGLELGNRRVALFGMLFAGTSYWLNVVTRVALRFSLYPMFVAPTMYFVVRGLRRGRRNDFIWAGIFLGLGLHGYSPFRFVPLLLVVALLLFMAHNRKNGSKVLQSIAHLGVLVAVSFVLFLPLVRFMAESEDNRSIVLYRSLTRIGTVEREYSEPPIQILAENMWRSFTMFAWDNGGTWVHSVVFRPALDVTSAALFYLGYFVLVARYLRDRRWEDGFMLVSVPFLLLPSAFSLAFPEENPSLNRSGGAIIPVFLIAALTLDGLMTTIRNWIGSKWGKTISWGVAGFLLLISMLSSYDLVFRQYNEQFIRSSWNTTELGSVIRGYADSFGSEDTAWVIPWPHWVDTRLVGINAEVYIRDYAIARDQLPATVEVPGPKLFIFNLQDNETLAALESLYPEGILKTYTSEFPNKDFYYYVSLEGQ